jgi:hypothetical protein
MLAPDFRTVLADVVEPGGGYQVSRSSAQQSESLGQRANTLHMKPPRVHVNQQLRRQGPCRGDVHHHRRSPHSPVWRNARLKVDPSAPNLFADCSPLRSTTIQ